MDIVFNPFTENFCFTESARVTALENTYVRSQWYKEIGAGTSGTLVAVTEIGANAEFVSDQWPDGVDMLISVVTTGEKPDRFPPRDAAGDPISATFNTSTGAWALSGTPVAYPVALIYCYRQKLGDFTDTKSLADFAYELPTDVGLIVREESGGVISNHINMIKFPDSTLTDNGDNSVSISIPHSVTTGRTNDEHSGYLWLAGRAGGQVGYGGTLTTQDLEFHSNLLKDGLIKLGDNSYFDEATDNLVIANSASILGGVITGANNSRLDMGQVVADNLIFYANGANKASFRVANTNGAPEVFAFETGHIEVVSGAAYDIYYFEDSANGENKQIRIYGYPAGTQNNFAVFRIIGAENDLYIQTKNLLGNILLNSDAGGGSVFVGTDTGTAQFEVKTLAATRVGAILKGYASQTAPMLEIQDSAGNSHIQFNIPGATDPNVYFNKQLGDSDFIVAGDTEANLLRVDAGTDTVRLGDWDTNYAKFAKDGELTLVGTARVKKEIRVPVALAKLGASAPTQALRQIGTTATMLGTFDQFSKTVQQDVYFKVHVPYDCDTTATMSFHIVWLPGAAWTAGNYVWKLEYIVKSEDAAYNTVASTIISADVTPANATNFIETEFATGITVAQEQAIYCHFYRDVASDNGDATGDISMFEFEYTINKLGEAT